MVDEMEAKDLANELNAIFITTSAKGYIGIDELFIKIGKRFLNPKSEINKSEDNRKINLIIKIQIKPLIQMKIKKQ